MYIKIIFFFFNDTATTEIYTLSLHDALPICRVRDHRPLGRPGLDVQHHVERVRRRRGQVPDVHHDRGEVVRRDRKSTRLNSSHANISYAVFCLKKKKKTNKYNT